MFCQRAYLRNKLRLALFANKAASFGDFKSCIRQKAANTFFFWRPPIYNNDSDFLSKFTNVDPFGKYVLLRCAQR